MDRVSAPAQRRNEQTNAPKNAQIRHLKLPSSASNFPTSVMREEESIEKSSEELEEEELLELLELVELLVVLVEDGGVVASLVSGEVGEPKIASPDRSARCSFSGDFGLGGWR